MERKGIGCSELDNIFNIDYGCSRKLYYVKTKAKEDRPRGENPHLERGKALEPIARAQFTKKTGKHVEIMPDKLLESTECPLTGHVDGVIDDGRQILELKCPGLSVYYKIKREGMPYSYILQLNGYIYLWGRSEYGTFGVFHPDPMDIQVFDMPKEKALIDSIVKKTNEFWELVQKKTPPDRLEIGDSRCVKCPYIDTCWEEKAQTIDGLGSVSDDEAEDLTEDEKLSQAVRDFLENKAQIKIYEGMKEMNELLIKDRMGEKEKAKCGNVKISYRYQKEVRWDLKKLEAEKPELKEEYSKENLKRPLRVTAKEISND